MSKHTDQVERRLMHAEMEIESLRPLAQFGARVLEILRAFDAYDVPTDPYLRAILRAARSLGLLGEEAQK